MADILIRGMEMPHDCDECKLCAFIPIGEYGLDRKCMPLNRNAEITIRRKDCPLVELPPHGDLIERVQTLRAINNCDIPDGVSEHDFYEVIASVHEALEKVPVVIPSNREETE